MQKPPVKTIRLTEKQKKQLIKLKGITKIYKWNVLCRWAFCYSLSQPGKVSRGLNLKSSYSNVEISWKTFGGKMDFVYIIALKQRCIQDKIELTEKNLKEQFYLHLERGIFYLASQFSRRNHIEDFVSIALTENSQ